MQSIICACGCQTIYNLLDFQRHYMTERFKSWLLSDFSNHKDEILIKCGCGSLYNTRNQYNHYKMIDHKQWELKHQAYEKVFYICPYCCFIFNYGKLAEHKTICQPKYTTQHN